MSATEGLILGGEEEEGGEGFTSLFYGTLVLFVV